MRGKMLIFLALLCAMLLAAGWMAQQAQIIAEEQAQLQEEILTLEQENALLRERVAELKKQQAELGSRMEKWLDEWEVDIWEATSYAPLDPRAIPGVCYSGDPAVTASGARVVPGITAAAGADVPFGTLIKVEGAGWRRITDRGGRIGPGHIDLAMVTREEALAWGRKNIKVVYQK
jgi:3D (Asp-Asp-Asp) domain-containing protein